MHSFFTWVLLTLKFDAIGHLPKEMDPLGSYKDLQSQDNRFFPIWDDEWYTLHHEHGSFDEQDEMVAHWCPASSY